MELILTAVYIGIVIFLVRKWIAQPSLLTKANPDCPWCRGSGLIEWEQDGVEQMEVCDCVPNEETQKGDGGKGELQDRF